MKILHLYYDIMNLYGDYANISALCRMIEKSGEVCTVDRLSLSDNAVLDEYDFIFVGSGTEKHQKLVLEDFKKYADSFKAYIGSGKVALFTGNSFEMLGKTITDCVEHSYDGIGLFDFTVKEQNKTRVTADVIYEADFLDKPIVGFVNKCSEISGIANPLFQVTFGLGDNAESKTEGVRLNNFFGTHLTGPAFIKNPHFLAYAAELVLGKGPVSDYLVHECAGFEITLSELKARMNSN